MMRKACFEEIHLFILALTDRANEVSVIAEQVNSGATDTTCHFNAGGDDYFEWYIQASSSSYSSAYSSGSFHSATEFQNILVKAFFKYLSAVYSSEISDVKFVSQKQSGNGDYILLFRIYFKSKITTESQRTDVVSKIQTSYQEVIKNHFKAASSKMKISNSVQIKAPKPVETVSKKAIVTSSKDSSKSILTGSLHNATLVSSSSNSNK